MLKLLDKIIKYKFSIFFLLLILLLLSIHVAVVFPTGGNRLSGNAVSLVMMATAPLREIGVPYKDYWEYKPPGIMLLVGFWVKMFGSTMFSFKILQLLFLLGTGPLIYLVLRKIFSPFYGFILASLAAVVLYSPYLSFTFLPEELFGLFFSLLGLVCLLYLKGIGWRFFLSAFFIALASQMKNPFASTMLAIAPPLIYLLVLKDFRSFLRAMESILGGILLVFLIVGSYLVAIGSLRVYLEVLNFEVNTWIWSKLPSFQDSYYFAFWHAKNIFLYFQSEVFPVLLLWFLPFLLSIVLKGRPRLPSFKRSGGYYEIALPLPTVKLEITPQAIDMLTVIFYSLGSFVLFSMYGFFDFQYLYQIAMPIYFFWSIVIKSILDNLKKVLPSLRIDLLLLPILLIFLFPKGPYLKSYNLGNYNPFHIIQLIHRNITLPDGETPFEDYINAHTGPSSCILSVYGWGVGETYFYAQRRPCSRFFLPHLVLVEWQKKEFRESILQNPPQAIVYTQEGADLDVVRFEKEVIDFSRIIERCYRLDSEYPTYSSWQRHLYFPRFQDDQLKSCIKQDSLSLL